MCVAQVRPAVIPRLQHLLACGTFRPFSLDVKALSASGSSSSPSSDPQAMDPQTPSADIEEEEQSRARLIFTAEKSVPWIDQLVTQIKVERN